MMQVKRGVVLVGHGGLPQDCPRELVQRFKQLEGQRKGTTEPPGQEEIDLDRQIRHWPRTAENDPYFGGIQRLQDQLAPRLSGVPLIVAYNEFCAPTVEDAVAQLVDQGVDEIVVVPTMMTPGGSHSEREIPELLDGLRHRHPKVSLRYAWPFELAQLAELLAGHIGKF